MLGDVAVAVHPDDERYKKFHGRKLKHPFIDRELIIICDSELVDPTFGTGAVKITPAHDPNDFKCGQRHKLEFINILSDDGHINENGGKYQGQMRYDVRYQLITELTELGLFRGTAPNPMRLGVCSRSKDIVEPIIRPQWFCKCEQMGKRAVEAVRSGELQLLPPNMHEGTWYNWMENIQDWCVSRQLWWGHQIPAYLVIVDGVKPAGYQTSDWIVADSHEKAMEQALKLHPGKDIKLERDGDVLDTWFSSGLFPFSVFGWPNNTKDFNAFYPTSLLETGHDILFFWVARMVMMGQQLTGQLPFKKVYLHAMVRDKYGRKMSKSLGNVLDPIHVMEGISLEQLQDILKRGNLDPAEVEKAAKGQELDFPNGIPECGADALRFGLLAYTTQGRDINLDINRVVSYRQFCNKLWNATKFALMNFPQADQPAFNIPEFNKVGTFGNESFADRWILHQLNNTCKELNKAFGIFDFSAGTQLINDFWWDLCDYYLELIKPVMYSDTSIPENVQRKNTSLAILYTCLDHGLRLMHPFMPFVTEELYQRLPGRKEEDSIAISGYPTGFEHWNNDTISKEFKLYQEVVHGIRSSKSTLGLESNSRPSVYVQCSGDNFEILSRVSTEISTLAKTTSTLLLKDTDPVPEGTAMSPVNAYIFIHIVLTGLLNFENEIQKQTKKKEKLSEFLQAAKKKMSVPGWRERTPADVVLQMDEKNKDIEAQISKIEDAVALFSKLLLTQSNSN